MASETPNATLVTAETTNTATDGQASAARTNQIEGSPPPEPAVSRVVALAWCGAAVVFVAGAAWASYSVARATVFDTAHRAAAAWTGLLVVVALAVVAQGILLCIRRGN